MEKKKMKTRVCQTSMSESSRKNKQKIMECRKQYRKNMSEIDKEKEKGHMKKYKKNKSNSALKKNKKQ